MIARRLVQRTRSTSGYTLIELVVVLSIFTIVVTALVQLFTSGAKAELDMNRRFQAQQEARLALADALGVAGSSVVLRRGARSRTKVFEIEGVDQAGAEMRLRATDVG